MLDDGEFSKALEHLTGLGSIYMNDPAFFLALGRAHLGMSNYQLASAAFSTAAGKKPDSAEAHLWLACAKALLKNYKDALDSIDQAAKLDPADARIAYVRCLIHMLSGDLDKAVRDGEAIGKNQGGAAKSLADQLQDLAKLVKEQDALAAKKRDELNELKGIVDKAAADFKEAKAQWETASADRAKMLRDRDEETRQARVSNVIPGDVADKTPYIQQLNQVLAEIENRYRQQIEALDAKMKDLSAQGEKLQTQIAKDKTRLSALEAKEKQSQTSSRFEIVQVAMRTLPPVPATIQPAAAASRPAAVVEKIIKPDGPAGNGDGKSFMGLECKAQRLVFVLDKSGSMGMYQKFFLLRKEMLKSIDQLQSDQFFHVIFFDTGALENTPKQLVAASGENKTAAAAFLKNTAPVGGTNPVAALKRAFETLKDSPGEKVIFLLSDGEIPNGTEVLNMIKAQNPAGANQVVINTILYNDKPLTAQIMETIARENKGQYKFVNPHGE